MKEHLIDLSTLVQRVRGELESLDRQRRAKGKDALFEFKQMELKLSFVVTRSTDVEGGLDLKILSLGAKKVAAREQVHTVKIMFASAHQGPGPAPLGARFTAESAPTGLSPSEIEPL